MEIALIVCLLLIIFFFILSIIFFIEARKNRKSKKGWSRGTKESRKLERQLIRAQQHKLFKLGLLN